MNQVFSKVLCGDFDFIEFIQELLNSGKIDNEEARKITKLIIDGDINKGDNAQWESFVEEVLEQNYIAICSRCATKIPWCEMLNALDNGELCNWCEQAKNKLN